LARAEVGRFFGVVVEHRQVVMGGGGLADHLRHRQQGAAAGDRVPGTGLQLGQCGGHHHGDG
jgi:hypothetical protein